MNPIRASYVLIVVVGCGYATDSARADKPEAKAAAAGGGSGGCAAVRSPVSPRALRKASEIRMNDGATLPMEQAQQHSRSGSELELCFPGPANDDACHAVPVRGDNGDGVRASGRPGRAAYGDACGQEPPTTLCPADPYTMCVATYEPGDGCGWGCHQCWCGTPYQNNCPWYWRGDGECDCGCQWCDYDCPVCRGSCDDLPTPAYVNTGVDPAECGTMSPPAGMSVWNSEEQAYIFCSTLTPGPCQGRLCVRLWIDNPSPAPDSEAWWNFDLDFGACPVCGDGDCESWENCINCRSDCACGPCAECIAGQCVSFCGDGTCQRGCDETCLGCFDDCGATPGSFNFGGHGPVEWEDHAGFLACTNGPGKPYHSDDPFVLYCCQVFDLDDDGDLDLGDWCAFQAAFEGLP